MRIISSHSTNKKQAQASSTMIYAAQRSSSDHPTNHEDKGWLHPGEFGRVAAWMKRSKRDLTRDAGGSLELHCPPSALGTLMGNEGVTTGQEYKKRGASGGWTRQPPSEMRLRKKFAILCPIASSPLRDIKQRYPTHCRSGALLAQLGVRSPATLTGRG